MLKHKQAIKKYLEENLKNQGDFTTLYIISFLKKKNCFREMLSVNVIAHILIEMKREGTVSSHKNSYGLSVWRII